MKTLILTEKPSVARDFAKALGVNPKGDGFFENQNLIITWAIGHLMELKEPSEYDKKWKSWNLSSLPILPDRLAYKINSKTKKQCLIVLQQLKRKDLSRIVLATDAGREGELIGRTLINEARPTTVSMYRFWTSQALSVEVIKKSLSELKPLVEYDRLYYAGRARQSADWLVGMNLSRLATIKMGDLFSVGRVQTAVLALLVNKRKEIDSFISKAYFGIQAKFKFESENLDAVWFDPKNKIENTRIDTEDRAIAIIKKCEAHKVKIESIIKEKKKFPPPQLFSLTELQKVANRAYGFSAKKTLTIAQSLYEQKKCLSYPRTDSRVLGTDSFSQVNDLIQHLKTKVSGDFKYFDPEKLSLKNKRVFDNSKLTDHHALMPLKFVNLIGDEAKIFDLVVRRFITVFLKDFSFEETKIISSVNSENFLSKGQTISCIGWKDINGSSAEKFLPALQENQIGEIQNLKYEKKMTKPPLEYTEASLLQDMINPSRLVQSKELKKVFKGDIGLGTQSTRAAIIETLIARKYIMRKAKNLLAVNRGILLIESLEKMDVSKVLTCPEETATWEVKLDEISRGEGDPKDFMIKIRKFINETSSEWKEMVTSSNETPLTLKEALGQCPICQSSISESPKSYSCAKWREGCKFTIWKKIAGKKISATQAKKILKDGKSDLLKGFKSKAKKSFDAYLVVKENNVIFEFGSTNASALEN